MIKTSSAHDRDWFEMWAKIYDEIVEKSGKYYVGLAEIRSYLKENYNVLTYHKNGVYTLEGDEKDILFIFMKFR